MCGFLVTEGRGERMDALAPCIAIVDDDESVRRALHRLLRSEGFAATTFASAFEYMEASRLQEFACLILDIHLGRMSGLELAEYLEGEGRRVPIIIITAFDDAAARDGASRVGVHAYFRKPVNAQLLLDAVRSAMGAPPPASAATA